jgi:hypothetical protein
MLGEFFEFTMGTADVAELGRAKFGQVGLIMAVGQEGVITNTLKHALHIHRSVEWGLCAQSAPGR